TATGRTPQIESASWSPVASDTAMTGESPVHPQLATGAVAGNDDTCLNLNLPDRHIETLKRLQNGLDLIFAVLNQQHIRALIHRPAATPGLEADPLLAT